MAFARSSDNVVGAMLSYQQGLRAYFHLMGLGHLAHRLGTSYALLDSTLSFLEQQGCARVSLGSGRGVTPDPSDGLYQFKSRWTDQTEDARLCGLVLDDLRYVRLVHEAKTEQATFFPSYRAPRSRFAWIPTGE